MAASTSRRFPYLPLCAPSSLSALGLLLSPEEPGALPGGLKAEFPLEVHPSSPKIRPVELLQARGRGSG